MNIPKVSNMSFNGKLKLGGFAKIVKKDSLGEFPVMNFNKHKALIEDSMFPDSTSYKPVAENNPTAKQGLFKGDFIVDTKDIKEIDDEKLTVKQPRSDYTTYIYHTLPQCSLKTDYNHILKAYIAASMNDDVVVSVEKQE